MFVFVLCVWNHMFARASNVNYKRFALVCPIDLHIPRADWLGWLAVLEYCVLRSVSRCGCHCMSSSCARMRVKVWVLRWRTRKHSPNSHSTHKHTPSHTFVQQTATPTRRQHGAGAACTLLMSPNCIIFECIRLAPSVRSDPLRHTILLPVVSFFSLCLCVCVGTINKAWRISIRTRCAFE